MCTVHSGYLKLRTNVKKVGGTGVQYVPEAPFTPFTLALILLRKFRPKTNTLIISLFLSFLSKSYIEGRSKNICGKNRKKASMFLSVTIFIHSFIHSFAFLHFVSVFRRQVTNTAKKLGQALIF